MPMWGLIKARPALKIHPMEFTRARLDKERRGKAVRPVADPAPARPVQAAGKRDPNNTYINSILAALADLRNGYAAMIEAPAISQSHTDRLHRASLELTDLAKPMGYRDIAQAAQSLAQLSKATDRAMAHPELIKLHIDGLGTLADQAARNEPDDKSAQLLKALKAAVDAALVPTITDR